MSGWISIERDLFKNEFFASEPMSEREAWVWMIAQAAYTDTRHRVGGAMLPVPRGSFMHTLRELMSAFGWNSDTKVRNFLKRLESDEMITREVVGSRNAPKTHVTICNYNEYQSYGRTENARETHEKRTENVVKEQGNKVTKEDTNVSSVHSAFSKQDFQDFWDAYPHRDGKKNRAGAEASFKRAIKSGVTVAEIADGVRNMANDPNVQRGYARDPTTWLNQKGWTDEFEARPFSAINGSGQDRSRMIIKAAATGTTQQDWG